VPTRLHLQILQFSFNLLQRFTQIGQGPISKAYVSVVHKEEEEDTQMHAPVKFYSANPQRPTNKLFPTDSNVII
jgi:hypothetical protein